MYAKNASCDVKTMENVITGAQMIRDKIHVLASTAQFTDGLLKNITFFERYHYSARAFNVCIYKMISRLVLYKEKLSIHPALHLSNSHLCETSHFSD
jgi:hypothetical protein